MVFCLFGIHWAMPYKVIELLASWRGKFERQKYRFLEVCAILSVLVFMARIDCYML